MLCATIVELLSRDSNRCSSFVNLCRKRCLTTVVQLGIVATMDTDSLPRHPIRVVARRTGLTPATIRAWERRYDAVSPSRSEGKQRLYSDRDVERLRTLKQLTGAGRSISTVAALSEAAAAADLLSEDQALTAHAASVSARFPKD